MVDQAKLQEVFADKEYVESIVKMSAEDAAKSLCKKGVEVTADELMKIHDFIMAHSQELQNGELPEETLAQVAGGFSIGLGGFLIITSVTLSVVCAVGLFVFGW